MKFFAVDISGSTIAQEGMLDKILADIRARSHDMDMVCTFDTRVVGDAWVMNAKDAFRGTGGGTDLECVLRWVESHGGDNVIIYSDGWFNRYAPMRNPDIKVSMISTGAGAADQDQVDRIVPGMQIIHTIR